VCARRRAKNLGKAKPGWEPHEWRKTESFQMLEKLKGETCRDEAAMGRLTPIGETEPNCKLAA